MHLIFTGATDLVGFGVLNQMLPLIPGRTSKLTILSRGPADIEKARRSRGLCVGPKAYPNHWLVRKEDVKTTKDYPSAAANAFRTMADSLKHTYISGKFLSPIRMILSPANLQFRLQQSQGKFTQTFAAVKGKCEKALLDMAKAKHIFQSLFPPANHVDPSITLAPALVPPTQEIGIITTALAMGTERAWKGQHIPKPLYPQASCPQSPNPLLPLLSNPHHTSHQPRDPQTFSFDPTRTSANTLSPSASSLPLGRRYPLQSRGPGRRPRISRVTGKIVQELILSVLVWKLAYRGRDILIFEYVQGDSVGLSVRLEVGRVGFVDDGGNGERELGGIVTVGGILPLPATKEDGKGKAETLVLLVGAQRPEDAITDAGLCRMKANFEYVKVVKWKGRMGDETPSNREEMFPITQFLVKRWRSTSGVPDGSIEIS
ncbi:hypothetical protein GX48_02788 [Paracoccidioides brasiliensis]|nr:hypothetical protein GX48_02788 [Paracoccidioides brasiliensis]